MIDWFDYDDDHNDYEDDKLMIIKWLYSQPTLRNTINNLNNLDQILNQTLEAITE